MKTCTTGLNSDIRLFVLLLPLLSLFLFCSQTNNKENRVIGQPVEDVVNVMSKIFGQVHQILPLSTSITMDGQEKDITYYVVGRDNRRLGYAFRIFDNICGECGFNCATCDTEIPPCPNCYPLDMVVGIKPDKSIQNMELINPIGSEANRLVLARFKYQFRDKTRETINEPLQYDTLTGATRSGQAMVNSLNTILDMIAENDFLEPESAPMDEAIDYDDYPKIVVSSLTIDMGQVKVNTKPTFNFTIRNEGGETLEIEHIGSSWGCTVVPEYESSLEPGESTQVGVEFSAGSRAHRVSKSIRINNNDPLNRQVTVILSGEVVE